MESVSTSTPTPMAAAPPKPSAPATSVTVVVSAAFTVTSGLTPATLADADDRDIAADRRLGDLGQQADRDRAEHRDAAGTSRRPPRPGRSSRSTASEIASPVPPTVSVLPLPISASTVLLRHERREGAADGGAARRHRAGRPA